jgi:2-polyprenyl-3-methyl-5-hydroxy-6-metoxy-1,4-benzoquinol methylase
MLEFGRRRLAGLPELQDRVSFVCGILPDATLSAERFDVLISNSLLHHLHDPAVLWGTIVSHAAPGASVLVMDLYRPVSRDHAASLVDEYAGDEPEVLKTDFYNSLLAAFSPEEVRVQLDDSGLDVLSVEKVSDRHMLVSGTL